MYVYMKPEQQGGEGPPEGSLGGPSGGPSGGLS
jgi:hypothetical protein